MPLYDYVCSNSHEFACLAGKDETRFCPKCGSKAKWQFPKRNHVVWGQGAALVDVYDRDEREMNGN